MNTTDAHRGRFLPAFALLSLCAAAALVACGGDAEGGQVSLSGGSGVTGGVATSGGIGITGGMVSGGLSATGGSVTGGLPKGSFFVTSLESMRELSGSQDGFGGDFGGIAGADNICQQIAAKVGLGAKTWRAFLSAPDDGSGNTVHAIERIGSGPWYDVNERLIAENIQGLLGDRPDGDPQTVLDLPNEFGEGQKQYGDNHDTVTGSDAQGRLLSTDPSSTCNSWTSTTVRPSGGVRIGHSWPRSGSTGRGANWMSDHTESSCAAGVNLIQNGGGDGSSIGAGGGYGGIYCFALQP